MGAQPEVRAVRSRRDAVVLELPDRPGDPGDPGDPASRDLAAVRAAAGRAGRELPAGRSVLAADGISGARLSALVEGLLLGTYRFTRASEPAPGPTRIDLAGADDSDGALARGRASAAAVCWARDLANTPAATKTPAWLAAQAVKVLGRRGVEVTVRDERWLEAQGFGGVLAVGGGSASPPRLIEATWHPRGAPNDRHLVLVGKGITFDTGGVNRKTGDGMRTMHTDMAGGAAVLGALRLIAERNIPVRVSALVPSAENALSGSSYRPGDVVRHHGGRTSEIRNTDAEGRIVLADALAYAVGSLAPTALVDVATLTGAMKIALGLRTGGLLSTSDALARDLLAAADASGEALWRLPLLADYESTLRSDIADAQNAPGNPGGITAGLFLKPFAGGVPWAHLDVAGPARAPEDDGMLAKGGTGYGVRLLTAWAETAAS